MTYVTDPNYCAICDEGLYEKGQRGQPQRIGKVVQTGGRDAIKQMDGTPEQKREAKRGLSLKVGFCPDCLDKYDLEPPNWETLDEIYGKITLARTEIVPLKKRRK